MAWRARPRVQPRRPAFFEALSLLTLLVPLLVGGILVAALQHQGSAQSPLILSLIAATAGAAALIYHLDSRRRERPLVRAVAIARTVRPRLPAAAAVLLSGAAATLTIRHDLPAGAVVCWLVAMALLLGYAMVLEHPRLHPPTPIDAISLIGLMVLTLALRLPYLTDLPAFVHSDEAQMGLNTRLAFEGHMPSLFAATDWWSVPWLGPALQAPLMLFFGEGLESVRLASVIAAALATAGLWFLGSEMWSRRAGFVAALLFAMMAPSVHFGRDGVHYMQSIAALVWTVLCYTRATKRYSGAYAALTGILIGIDVQLYYAARLAVPLVLLHAGVRSLTERGLLRNWVKLLLWTGLGMATAFLPMGAFYLTHPAAFAQRTDAVFVLSSSPGVRSALLHDYGVASWPDILWRQAQSVIMGFLALGDRSEQYGSGSALLDPVTAALVPASLALALARVRQSPWLLCVSWAAVTVLLGGILTTFQPDAPRLLPALPAVCLLVGGLLHTILESAGQTGLRDAKPLAALAIAAALIAAGVANANAYIQVYPAQAATQSITLVSDVGRYIGSLPDDRPVVLYDHREFYLAHWSIRLLAPQVTGLTVWTPKQLGDSLAALHGSFTLVAVDEPVADLQPTFAQYGGGTPVRVPVHDTGHMVIAYSYTGAGLV
jgi:4-amino-4-deoxy-L-arabinose transferase-like glycosyltransferase